MCGLGWELGVVGVGDWCVLVGFCFLFFLVGEVCFKKRINLTQ